MKAQIRGSKYTNKLGVRESFSGEVIPQQSLERLKRCQVRKAFQVHYERCEAAGKLAGWYIAAALSQLIDLGVGSPYELSQSSELFPDGENFRCNNWKLLVVVVQKDMVRSSPPVPQKVTLFGNRVFTEIINLK